MLLLCEEAKDFLSLNYQNAVKVWFIRHYKITNSLPSKIATKSNLHFPRSSGMSRSRNEISIL